MRENVDDGGVQKSSGVQSGEDVPEERVLAADRNTSSIASLLWTLSHLHFTVVTFITPATYLRLLWAGFTVV